VFFVFLVVDLKPVVPPRSPEAIFERNEAAQAEPMKRGPYKKRAIS